jgi:hypothetical protein
MVQDRQGPVERAPASFQAEQRLGQFAHRLHPAFAIKHHKISRVADGDAVVPMV